MKEITYHLVIFKKGEVDRMILTINEEIENKLEDIEKEYKCKILNWHLLKVRWEDDCQ